MANIFVEWNEKDNKYLAYQNHRVIATGSTQRLAADRAHNKKPNDPVFVERVRNTSGGSPDKWRRVY